MSTSASLQRVEFKTSLLARMLGACLNRRGFTFFIRWVPMSERTWQQIAKELAKETSPCKRRKLEEELSSALKNGSFQIFGKRNESSERFQQED